jgi:hypothetical protein
VIRLRESHEVTGFERRRAAGAAGPWRTGMRKLAGVLAIAIVTISAGLLLARRATALDGAPIQDGPGEEATIPAELAPLVIPIERRLRGCRERLVGLAGIVVENRSRLDRLRDEQGNQAITVENCKTNLGNATLAREVAEIAVVEYKEGIFKQDKATAEGEHKRASSDLDRAEEHVTKANERLAKIKEVSKGTTTDLANEYLFEDRVIAAELEKRRARFAIEQAVSKLTILEKYTKPKTVLELESEVERARSAELAKKADFELAQGKLARSKRMTGKKELPVAERKMLALLERGVSVDDTIRTKLEELMKKGKPDHELLKNVQELTNQLERVVEHAEAERAASQLEKLKPTIHDAARAYLGAGR